ncbi:putative phosphotransferase enzyme family protein [Phaeomoniella chlamydospora]|uniref:protein-ribulosamine 3-kinase n=1 Tax=Phaeomoniella chlamydospora TaxID=158046 RepID=A0A0G2E7Y7_PHACM|nr:putative phosphotransferase enzyme family protein [Phaeomoniella chlamydospora]
MRPKPTTLDPAVVSALAPLLPPYTTPTASTHGGSGFASTYSITTPSSTSSRPQKFFMKTTSAPGAEVMFRGEHASLNAISDVVPSLAPRAYGFGKLENSAGYFLVTDFLDMSGGFGRRKSTSTAGSGMSLAEKLAKLHSTPAPIPEGYNSPMFGFPVTTCCGDTPQDNEFLDDWAKFYGEKRLMGILKRGEQQNGKDSELRKMVETLVQDVVPRLLRKGHLGGKGYINPVVIHGDLWSGNKGIATIDSPAAHSRSRTLSQQQSRTSTHRHSHLDDEPHLPTITETPPQHSLSEDEPTLEEIIFDPSSVYGHSEYELGIMSMFGGFSSSFMKDYHRIVPKTEPVDEYDDRIQLYELYHHLNHYAIFGGGYKGGAMGIGKRLIAKYT